MTRRPAVDRLLELAPFPMRPVGSDLSQGVVDELARRIDAIAPPVSTEEAKALLSMFGPEDCYGLEWTLIHLIETAPSSPMADCVDEPDNEFLKTLWLRYRNGLAEGRG